MNAPAWLSTMTGSWHPIGRVGLAAAVLGIALGIASAILPPASPDLATHRGVDASIGQLDAQRAAIADRMARSPGAERQLAEIVAIASLARDTTVTLGAGDYHDAPATDTASSLPPELLAVNVRLPFHGSPAAVRAFLAGLQRELPWLAIDRLRIERSAGLWNVELQGRLLLRRSA